MALSRESSFGSWPSCSSEIDVQSVNSGVESESISPPSEVANGDITSTHPAADEIHTNQVSEAVPNLTNESKMPLDDENVTAERHLKTSPPKTSPPKTSPPKTSPLNTANLPTQHQTLTLSQTEKEYSKKKQSKAVATTSTLTSVKAPELKGSNVLVYDIASLLELSKGPSATPVELERCDEDIKENLFKDYLRRDHAHLRGLSNTSTVASESMETEEQIVFMSQAQRSQRKPVRQPFGPPQSSLAQQNEGFARFLREHASPPHHRVTAGGRIVPNSPLSPPPMFRLETIDSVVQQDQNHTPAAQTQNASSSEMTSSCNATRAEQPNSTSTGSASSKQQGHAAPSGTTTKTSESSALGSNGQRQASIVQPLPSTDGRVLQIPVGAVPTMALPEGGLIINYQGLMYRATLNQANGATDLDPLQVICQAPEIQQPVTSYQQNPYFTRSLGFQPMTRLPSSSMVAPSMPLANSTNGAHVFQHHHMQNQVQIQYLQNQYDSLRLQLEELDRHVALYRHVLSPMVNASMVAQRMQLVQQLDSVRVTKDKLQRSNSMASQNPGFLQAVHMPQGSQVAFEQSGRQNLQSAAGVHPYNPMTNVRSHMMGVAAPATLQVPHARPVHEIYSSSKSSNKTPTTQNGLKNTKYLSPDAPAFVPNKTSATAFNKGGKTQEQCDEKILSKAATHQVTHTVTPKPTRQAKEQLPKVTQEDVEYVEDYAYNDGLDPKQYCSTVEEYQEVIRRVREQARMYGCAGGQSKDPEHDAEEDIRWAMSDNEAIPLPTAVPDHIKNPRPWNWGDSAFNIRSDLDAYHSDFSRFDKDIHPSLRRRGNIPWGPIDVDDGVAAPTLNRRDSWDSQPPSPPFTLSASDFANWGKLPSDMKAEPAFGPKLPTDKDINPSLGKRTNIPIDVDDGVVAPILNRRDSWDSQPPSPPFTLSAFDFANWGNLPSDLKWHQPRYDGGAPPEVTAAVANQSTFKMCVQSPSQGSIDSWDSPVRSSFAPNANNRQDDYVGDGGNTSPFTATTTNEAWGQRDPYSHQSKAPHDAAKNNHQFSKGSGQVKGQSEEPNVGHTYAKATTVSHNDASKSQKSRPPYPLRVRKDSTRKPHQAYVEDAVDSPNRKVSYWDIIEKRNKDEENKDDDDASSLDSWITRPEIAASRNAALAKMVPENLRDQGSMNRPLSTNVLPGKAFEPSEVKAVGVPSPASNTEAKPYYLNVMKHPRYGVTTGDLAPASDGVDRRSSKSRNPAKKENKKVLRQGNTAGRGDNKKKRGGPSNVASNVGMRQIQQVHKAPSSIAAPVYQAHGYLPQYDGAANSLNSGNSTVGPHHQPQSRALLGGGVSVAGPPTGRMEHFPTGHYDAGPHFFRNPREQEREEMARHKPLNPPHWQV